MICRDDDMKGGLLATFFVLAGHFLQFFLKPPRG